MVDKKNIETSEEESKIYCSHTCRCCKKAFIDIDDIGLENISPSYKACSNCIDKGVKKEDKAIKALNTKIDNIYSYVSMNTPYNLREYEAFILNKALDIVDKDSKIRADNAFKQSAEILNYYLEDDDFSFKDFELEKI